MATKLNLAYSHNEQIARNKIRDSSENWLGDFGEAIWSHVFCDSGIPYIALAKIFDGGAPVIKRNQHNVILPDFEIMLDGQTAFVDSKAKRRSVIFRLKKQERHGIDRRNWEHYCNASELAGKACGIAIVECFREDVCHWSGSLLIETLRNLSTPEDGFSTERHMVYWPRKRFVDLSYFSACELLDIANGKMPVRWGYELRRIFWPVSYTQGQLFD